MPPSPLRTARTTWKRIWNMKQKRLSRIEMEYENVGTETNGKGMHSFANYQASTNYRVWSSGFWLGSIPPTVKAPNYGVNKDLTTYISPLRYPFLGGD